MTLGFHRVEIYRADGYSLSKDFNVSEAWGSYPHEAFWDCDFTANCQGDDEDW
jgi:hypothetical protein